MLPILLYCTDSLGRAMLGPLREGAETEEFFRNAHRDIPLVIPPFAISGCRNASSKTTIKPDLRGPLAAVMFVPELVQALDQKPRIEVGAD